MQQHRRFSYRSKFASWLTVLVIVIALGIVMWAFQQGQHSTLHTEKTADQTHESILIPEGPPWLYGNPDARYTLIEYADLECPYCRAYFPVLRQWIGANPEVNWQWHHLPLAMHEPAATDEARLVECAGETAGNAAFWQAVSWVYTHTGGDGQGLPQDAQYPDMTPVLRQCLASAPPDDIVRVQAAEAARENITATPTLQLRDNQTRKTLRLSGPVEGDALLSALDLLSAGSETGVPGPQMPAGAVGDMPR
ncbi:DsbA family protein [Sodalis sp. RH19]|uniref:DsbA family protein n=1 Tax=Sodalis sp. RH19 TaxID=3394334 RepID=UPI0039B3EC13